MHQEMRRGKISWSPSPISPPCFSIISLFLSSASFASSGHPSLFITLGGSETRARNNARQSDRVLADRMEEESSVEQWKNTTSLTSKMLADWKKDWKTERPKDRKKEKETDREKRIDLRGGRIERKRTEGAWEASWWLSKLVFVVFPLTWQSPWLIRRWSKSVPTDNRRGRKVCLCGSLFLLTSLQTTHPSSAAWVSFVISYSLGVETVPPPALPFTSNDILHNKLEKERRQTEPFSGGNVFPAECHFSLCVYNFFGERGKMQSEFSMFCEKNCETFFSGLMNVKLRVSGLFLSHWMRWVENESSGRE